MNEPNQSLRKIFSEAVEIADAQRRAEYLATACGADSSLRQRIEELIAADTESGRFLGGVGDTVANAERKSAEVSGRGEYSDPLVSRHFGNYELLEEIARGGMGIVYRARQVGLDRIVAVKLLLLGQYASEEFIHRFRIEASAAASLQHPNIVAIHEVGVHQGQHYFAMDFVDGPDLAQIVRNGPLTAPRAAGYVKSIAEAIHFAHTRRILHRDLKPSNVLIDSNDQPRLTDFGLAKHLGHDSDLTLTGQVMGSPGFMPPEQALGERGKMGPASDVYSLGAILYHALTGRAPFVGQSIAETLQQVQSREVIAPRLLAPGLPVDLETICLKCLEKEPGKRFVSAQELAEELNRFLCGETIHARAVSRAGRVWRWCRRKPALAGLCGAIAALFIAVTAGSGFAAWHINVARRAEGREHQRAVEANERTERSNAQLAKTVNLLEIQRAEDFFRVGDSGVALAYLAGVLRRDPSNRIAAERLMSALALRPFALPLGPPLRHGKQVTAVEYSPDGTRLLSASMDRSALISDALTGALVGPPLLHSNAVLSAHFSPDGNWVVTASVDKTARIWNVRTGEQFPKKVPWGLPHAGVVYSARFSPDGQRVLTASAGKVARTWSVRDGQRLARFSGHSGEINSARFSPDGEWVVTGSADGTARMWNSRTGEPHGEPLRHQEPVSEAVFSPDGALLLTASEDGTARLWDARTGQPHGSPMRHLAEIRVAQFSPDGQRIFTASWDRTACLWDTATCLPLVKLFHPNCIQTACFSPDGRLIVTAALDNTARLWETSTGLPLSQPLRFAEQVAAVAFSPDGQQFVTGSRDRQVQRWGLPNQRGTTAPLFRAGPLHDIAFSPTGQWLITATEAGTVQIWDARTGQAMGEPLHHRLPVHTAVFSPDGTKILTASGDKTAQLWDAQTRQRVGLPMKHSNAVERAVFSPDGAQVLTGSWDHTARVWAARTGQPITPPLQHDDRVDWLAFTADGTRVATGSRDNTARVWDARTGQPVTPPLPHIDHIHQVVFSPDGKLLATASADNNARIWNARTGALSQQFHHARSVVRVEFSPDGQRIVTSSLDGTARVWEVSTGRAHTDSMIHEDDLHVAHFSPQGDRVLTASDDRSVRVWDAETGVGLTEFLRHPEGIVRRALFSPDGQRVASADPEGNVRVWEAPRAVLPVPNWLPELTEAIGGQRFDAYHTTALVSHEELLRWQGMVNQISPTNAWAGLVQRFGQVEPAGALPATRERAEPVQNYPARAVATWAGSVDLSRYYNIALTNMPHAGQAGNDLSFLPGGQQRFGGVEFDVRGVVQLASGLLPSRYFPRHVDGIRIGVPCHRLHFLHAAMFGHASQEGQEIGHYIVHYSHGQDQIIPIVYGRDLMDWWATTNQSPQISRVVAWTGTNPASVTQKRSTQLFKQSWTNPHPHVEVRDIDFVSAMAPASPFLVALTAEQP